jgi:hypothetical protein
MFTFLRAIDLDPIEWDSVLFRLIDAVSPHARHSIKVRKTLFPPGTESWPSPKIIQARIWRRPVGPNAECINYFLPRAVDGGVIPFNRRYNTTFP